MATCYLFALRSLLLAVISWFKPHQHTEASRQLVWAHPLESLDFAGWSGLGNYRVLSCLLLFAMVGLYVVFH